MHRPPRVRGGLAARLIALVAGLFLFAVGIVAQLESRLGLSPWDVLHQGIARHTPLSFGLANICVSVVVLAVGWTLGAQVGFATAANAVLVGGFIELLTSIGWVGGLSEADLGVRVILFATTLPLIGTGTALYLGAALGAGPRDALMVAGAERTRFRIGVVRGTIELSALAAGFVLGGTAGLGTLVFALGAGPAIEGGFWLLLRTPVAVPAPSRTPIPAPARLAGS